MRKSLKVNHRPRSFMSFCKRSDTHMCVDIRAHSIAILNIRGFARFSTQAYQNSIEEADDET